MVANGDYADRVPVGVVVGTGLLLYGALAYRAIGEFEMISSEGGLNFVEGKCPSKRNFDSTGILWYSLLYTQLGFPAAKQWDRPFTDSTYFMNEGLKCIRRNPLVLVTSLEGIPFLFVGNFLWPATAFSTAPYTRLYDQVFGLWLVIGLAVGYRSLWPLTARTYPVVIAWALPMLGLCLTVYVFESEDPISGAVRRVADSSRHVGLVVPRQPEPGGRVVQSRGRIASRPPMNGSSAVGITTDPSFCW